MENRGDTVAFVTLGCKLNYSETSTYAREFEEHGYSVVKPTEAADVYVINTCSVTDHSDKKCRNIIRRLHKKNPSAIIAVTGCYAQLKSDEILGIEGVDIVLGAEYKGQLYAQVAKIEKKGASRAFSCERNRIESIFPSFSTGERTRSFLKVQDGCDYFCAYCTVPIARGKSRNLPIALLVQEAEKIAASGIKEIVLTGVNTGDFGKSTGESFLDLLKALNGVEGIERYRISSIEPNLLTEEIVRWIASGTKFLPHFHIPLQSGSTRILGLMRRRYTAERYRERIAKIRELMPDSFLGVDVIVGFPGEGEEEFMESYRLLEEVGASFLHIFPFSERPGTPAVTMPGKVQSRVSTERVSRLEELSSRLHKAFAERFIGTERDVLFESTNHDGVMYGYTDNYLRVAVPYDARVINQICKVRLDSLDSNGDINATLMA